MSTIPLINPRRPPKGWFEKCKKSVPKSTDDPSALCGWVWHHGAKPKTKKKIMKKYENSLTEQKKRVLRNLHLRGVMGKMGSMSSKQRGKLLNELEKDGYITKNLELTRKGIEASTPFGNPDTITVRTQKGTAEVKVLRNFVFGNEVFSVHRSIGNRKYWQVSHRATGLHLPGTGSSTAKGAQLQAMDVLAKIGHKLQDAIKGRKIINEVSVSKIQEQLSKREEAARKRKPKAKEKPRININYKTQKGSASHIDTKRAPLHEVTIILGERFGVANFVKDSGELYFRKYGLYHIPTGMVVTREPKASKKAAINDGYNNVMENVSTNRELKNFTEKYPTIN